MIEQAVTSLAILKVNWDKGRSYVDNFVPFVAECLRTASNNAVSLPELQKAVSSTFGLIIPQSALKVILSRIFRAGYVKYERGIYIRTKKLDELPDILTGRVDTLRKYETLINRLEEFCERKYHVTWSQEQAENALLAYLEEHSISILTASIGRSLLSAPGTIVEHADFLIRSFIVYLYEHDQEGFDFLETVVKGRTLANVLFFPDISNVNQRIRSLDLYLDTRFVIRLMGWSGPNLQTPCQELLDVFVGEKVRFGIFDHTLSEIYGVLDATANALRDKYKMRRAYGETVDYFISQNKRSSDIEYIISQLPVLLGARNINITQRPPHTIPLGINEDELANTLQHWVGYQRKDALDHDIDALTSIHRLRGAQLYRTIESCKSIFVTTNVPLARASAYFFKKEYEGATVPLCTLDNVIATIMWVKKPVIFPELPKKRLIADCYAALNPSDSLWKLYLDEISLLEAAGNITEDDYHLLRYSTEARRALMDVTLGAPEAFVEGTVYEVLSKAREAVLEEMTQKNIEVQQRLARSQQETEQERSVRVLELTNIKNKLDQNAEAYAKRFLQLYVLSLIILWSTLIALIFKYGWDIMERWTYIIGGSISIFVYAYCAITQREYSPKVIYDKCIEAKKQKNYQEFGFNLNVYKKLSSQ